MSSKHKAPIVILAAVALMLWWLWPSEVESGRVIPVAVEGSRSRVEALALSPDSRYVAAVVWDIRFRSPRRATKIAAPLPGTGFPIRHESYRLSLWDTSTGAVVHDSLVRSLAGGVAFSPDGKWLAYSKSGLKAIRLADNSLRSWPVRGGGEAWPRFSPDGRVIAVGSGTRVTLCDFNAPGRVLKSTDNGGTTLLSRPRVYDAAFSPDGLTLAFSFYDELRLWQWKSDSVRRFPRNYRLEGGISCIAYSPDGRTLAIGTGIEVEERNATTLNLIRRIRPDNRVFGIAYSPDGRLLATSGPTFRTGPRLWARRFAAGRQSSHHAPINDPIGTVSLWDTRTGLLVRRMYGGRWAMRVLYSTDGRLITTYEDRDNIRIWDAP